MMVALAVFSLAALALIKLQATTLSTAADMDGKIMGQIVARNLMVAVETDPTPPSLGSEEGDVENGGRQWHWTREVTKTGDARVLRVDLVVNGASVRSPAVLTFVRATE
jgi:general secretion pathway protein I